MNLSSKAGVTFVAVANIVAACGAFVILGVYGTFVMWGASGWLYDKELSAVAVGGLTLLLCAGLRWRMRNSRRLMLASLASSVDVLIFTSLVFSPTIRSRPGSPGFLENMIWLAVPMVFLLLNARIAYSKFAQLNIPEVTPWPY